MRYFSLKISFFGRSSPENHHAHNCETQKGHIQIRIIVLYMLTTGRKT